MTRAASCRCGVLKRTGKWGTDACRLIQWLCAGGGVGDFESEDSKGRALWRGFGPALGPSVKPTIPTLRRQNGARGRRRDGHMGAEASLARSLAVKGQTNLALPVRSVSFGSAVGGASECCPCSPLRPQTFLNRRGCVDIAWQ